MLRVLREERLDARAPGRGRRAPGLRPDAGRAGRGARRALVVDDGGHAGAAADAGDVLA